MKKIFVFIGVVVVAAGSLYACGGSGSNPTGGIGSHAPVVDPSTTPTVPAPPIDSTPTAISTQTDAAKTAYATKTFALSFASGSYLRPIRPELSKPAMDQAATTHRVIDTVRDLQQRVAGLVEKQGILGKRVASVTTTACTGGGSVVSEEVNGQTIITYSKCYNSDAVEGYTYKDGTVAMPISFNPNEPLEGGTLYFDLTNISFADGGYSDREYESVLDMTVTIGALDKPSLTINGHGTNIDYVSNPTATSDIQLFKNFILVMTEETSGSVTTTTMTMDGEVSMNTFTDATFTTSDTASGMNFKNLQLISAVDSTNDTSSLTINGIFAIKTTPACMDGSFAVTTPTQSPVVLHTSSGTTTSGQMTVNGVVFTFNSDGTVTDSISNSRQSYSDPATSCSLSF